MSEEVKGITFTKGIIPQLLVLAFFWLTPVYINLTLIKQLSAIDAIKALLMAIGIAGVMTFQHQLHRFYGSSSVKEPGNMEVGLAGLGVGLVAGIALTFISTHLLWIWASTGLALTALYTISRRWIYSNEFIVGLVYTCMLLGAYTVFNVALLPPLGTLVLFIGLGQFIGLMDFAYRVITGDYGCPVPQETLSKLVLWLFVTLMVIGAGMVLM